VKWLTPLQLTSTTTTGATGAQPALPKNLTIRFGAHRASIYGTSHAAKTASFTTAAKDSVRESHARDFIANPVHPKILDEEFPEFQKLLDDLEEEVPPITLPCLSPLTPLRPATHLASSGQKRRAEGEHADLADTGASSSGTHPAKQLAPITGVNSIQVEAPEPENVEGVEPLTREEAVTAFVASPLLPEPNKLIIGHIFALMALAAVAEGPTYKHAV
jgi:hypothetical protein